MGPLGERGNAAFLQQLEELETFLARRFDDGYLRLGPDDPDVRRIIEASAYSSARAQVAAEDAMTAAVLRMAGETLDDVLALAPASAMVEVTGTARLLEPIALPSGTLLRVEQAAVSGGRLEPQTAFFTTMAAVTLVPLAMRGVTLVPVADPSRIELNFRVGCAHKTGFEIAFHVRRHSDFRSSSALLAALRACVTGATVALDDDVAQATSVAFGAALDERPQLERVRGLLHFPEQAMFVRVRLPEIPRGGADVCVRLALGAPWPRNLRVDIDSLRPSVLPMRNLWNDLAAPITHDGTRDAHPLRVGAEREAAELVRVVGVYDATKDLRPIVPLALGLSREGYEALPALRDGARHLRLRLAGALTKPVRVVVDATWSQPSLWASAPDSAKVSFQQRALKVDLRLLGAVRRPSRSPLADDPEGTLGLLALRARSHVTRAELVGLLELMGASGDSPYRGIPALLDSLTADDVPEASLGPGSFVREYRLRWRVVEPSVLALVHDLCACAELLLDALSEVSVRVVAEVRSSGGDT